jgi:hypothetical protein
VRRRLWNSGRFILSDAPLPTMACPFPSKNEEALTKVSRHLRDALHRAGDMGGSGAPRRRRRSDGGRSEPDEPFRVALASPQSGGQGMAHQLEMKVQAHTSDIVAMREPVHQTTALGRVADRRRAAAKSKKSTRP